jgi:hypothetical protein
VDGTTVDGTAAVDDKAPEDSAATPTASPVPGSTETPADARADAAAATPAEALAEDPRSTRMPERLRDLVTLLGVMLAEDDGLLPSRATVLAALAMLVPFLAYAAVALARLVPVHWPVLHIGAGQVPLATVATGAVLALAVSLPTYIYYRHQQRYITRLRRLLVRAYTRWWAECCARAEDAFRRAGLETLSAALDERLAAVDDFEARARTAAWQLRAEADQLDQSLHLSPAGRRDVFAVCGQIYPARRLSHLYRAVRERRQSEPLHPTHAGDDALGDAFRARLLGAGGRLLDLTSDDLAVQARSFGAEVTRPYLTGDLVAVAPAFRAGAVMGRDPERVPLTTLLERATPLYRPQPTDTPARLVVLAAPEDVRLPDRMDGPSGQGLTRAFTPSPEWMLTMQLVNRGRPRWWRRSLIEDPGRGALPMGLASAPTIPARRPAARPAARRAAERT